MIHCSSSSEKQHVSDIMLSFCHVASSHFILWPTACECHCPLFLLFSLITIHAITNRKWVTLPFFYHAISSLFCLLWQTACEWHHPFSHCHVFSSHFTLWPTACEWHCHFFLSFITHPMTLNSMWVTLSPFFSHALATSSDIIPWPTVCEWHCHFLYCSIWSDLIMTNSKCVTLHYMLSVCQSSYICRL